jgi:hypothetical protein
MKKLNTKIPDPDWIMRNMTNELNDIRKKISEEIVNVLIEKLMEK